jgi:hypothetical protein
MSGLDHGRTSSNLKTALTSIGDCCFGKNEGLWSGIDVEDVPRLVHRYMYTLRLYGHNGGSCEPYRLETGSVKGQKTWNLDLDHL